MPKEAENWYLNLSEETKNDYGQIKQAFLTRFNTNANRTKTYEKFVGLTQGC